MLDLDAITNGKLKQTGVSDFMELPIDKIKPNPNQPRKLFEDIEELSQSIKKHGLLEPIVITKRDDIYIIVAGERRYQAHILAKLLLIKCYIIDISDKQLRELALIENIQRKDLTDLELAKYIGELWATGDYKQKQDLAKAIGKSKTYISKAFSCLKLEDSIITDIEENKHDLSLSVLEELARVKDKGIQKLAYEQYLAKKITRDDIKDFKKGIFKDKPSKKKKIVCYGYGIFDEDWISVNINDADDSFSQIDIADMRKSNRVCQNKQYKITIEEM
jgi:ParB/RepB/Spo0J family partition protein